MVYIDEDEYWDPKLIANGHHHNFSGMIKINCANPDQLLSESTSNLFSEHLSKLVSFFTVRCLIIASISLLKNLATFLKKNEE